METPNTIVYEKLKELVTSQDVQSVGKPNRNVFSAFPAVTYMIANNSVTRDLDNEIASQNIEVVIDIYDDKSVHATDVLVLVEAKMRELDYSLIFSADVPNPTEDIYHITARFQAMNV